MLPGLVLSFYSVRNSVLMIVQDVDVIPVRNNRVGRDLLRRCNILFSFDLLGIW